ncbi:MAG: hypothetical protein GY870_01740 [archaeon]|nr:hypothetical protein [archaeon]
MIKNIKKYTPTAHLYEEKFSKYAEKFESELLRGISTLSVLSIIQQHPNEGIYGYQLLKELSEQTKIQEHSNTETEILVIEEGTLYPMLNKLENQGIIETERKEKDGRKRKYFIITQDGMILYNHLMGFFSKLMQAIAPLMDVEVELQNEKYLFCPNCANKIDLSKPADERRFCIMCGYNLSDRTEIEEIGGKKNE